MYIIGDVTVVNVVKHINDILDEICTATLHSSDRAFRQSCSKNSLSGQISMLEMYGGAGNHTETLAVK